MLALFVEDDPDLSDSYSRGLQSAGVDVVRCRTLNRALMELQRKREFDAIILDLKLPDSIGEGTFFRVKERAHGVPIVVLTATVDPVVHIRLIQEGASHVAEKTTSLPSDVAEMVRSAAAKRRADVRADEWEERTRPGFESKDAIPVPVLNEINQRVSPVLDLVREHSGDIKVLTASVADLADNVKTLTHEVRKSYSPQSTASVRPRPKSTKDKIKRVVEDNWVDAAKGTARTIATVVVFLVTLFEIVLPHLPSRQPPNAGQDPASHVAP